MIDFKKMEALRDNKERRYNTMIQHVLNLNVGESCSLTCNDLYDYFEFNYNPLKGNTPSTELNRWLEFLKTSKNIRSFEDLQAGMFRFKRFEKTV